MVKEVKTLQEFQNFLPNEKVVIDFYADWCLPCKKLAPKFQELSNQYDSITFIKINVDTEEIVSIIEKYNIKALPTFVFIKNSLEEKGYRVVGSDFSKVVENVKLL
jgi:thioredoxin 1